jgi:phage-related protein
MATFPSITPTYGAQKTSQPKVRQVQFGDGYSQRLSVGLNQNSKAWSLTWEVSETDADTIETFLDARAADGASFDWTPPDEATAYKWICYDWSKSIPYLNRATIQATFTQVFEPTP